MFNYIKFNLKMFPAYLVLSFLLLFNILLGTEGDNYLKDISGAIFQLVILMLIPNVFYMVRHNEDKGNILGFLGIIPLIPLPFILIAILMRIVYL
ncbi:hypothetical protein [Virgibacillus salinus]|uniref:Uncharacterized protein n=1 Tax=Virgibacillus salinus TaxID=553311 RepID=A0A1H1EX66_9BACI|nr:hypothetical protein [Virgibacillus salinus]SDQ93139.1 hypothetical protein SAMN05216231_3087 [Virgibacillus salinus]